ncbi:hypothetical protein [Pedobacter sp. BMA]|uniref:hypothetical protein n=1 Tax=Pedobacter sp. BMA TaxID=1663685 RepID=UPI00064B3575|nr:hypothetical protein [Pedobacter sp. BMA]KLT66269.1 hypothetical protein AB669_09020 [Pedobacter sp. BMA]
MKRMIFAVLLGVASISSMPSKAQVSLSINIGQQPAWGPTGYNHVDYYYLPDIDAYYYVPSRQYVYEDNGAWVWRNSLPPRYANYDLYNGYKVVMNSPKPYLSHNKHVTQYGKFKNYKTKQPIIRDSKDSRYTGGGNRNTPQNNRPSAVPRPNQVSKGNNGKNDNRPDRNQGKGNDRKGKH